MKQLIFAIFAASTLGLVACGSTDTPKETEKSMEHGAHGNTTNDPNAVLDPVCNMVKTDAWVDSATSHGQMFYFCSPVCKEQFEKNPHKFMGEHAH